MQTPSTLRRPGRFRREVLAPVLKDVTWLIGAGDRYGLLGANGAGKTTLLDVIQGKIAPAAGRVKIGQTVKFGVLSQQLHELDPFENDTIREVLSRYKRVYVVDGKETSPEKLLERLGFTTKRVEPDLRPVRRAEAPSVADAHPFGRAERAGLGRAR